MASSHHANYSSASQYGRGQRSQRPRPHNYWPLVGPRDFRIFMLHPGRLSEPTVMISMYNIDMTRVADQRLPDPEYRALSYTWGSPEDSEEILVGNDPEPSFIKVTRNCVNALRHLRHPSQAMSLWVDAICINQQDLAERARQVSMMDWIYTAARQVLVWLGTSSDDSGVALDCVGEIASKVGITWHPFRMWARTSEAKWKDPGEFGSSTDTLSFEQKWALMALFMRAWFGRLWIWQEVLLAEDAVVVCGHRSVKWTDLQVAFIYFKFIGTQSFGPNESQRLNLLQSLCTYDKENNVYHRDKFANRLVETSGAASTDSRDRVYALMSIINEQDTRHYKIRPDYTQPAEDLYRQVMLRSLTHANPMQLLQMVDIDHGRPGMPSWVPNLENIRQPHWLGASSCPHGNTTTEVVPSESDKNVLQVTGVLVSKIERVEPVRFPEDAVREYWANEVRRVASLFLPDERDSTYKQAKFAFGDVLLGGSYSELSYPEPNAESISQHEAHNGVDAILRNRTDFTGNEVPRLDPQDVDFCLNNMVTLCANRSFFQTADGKYGLGPGGTQAGDVVAVFLGNEATMILRPQRRDPGGTQQYKIVGAAYCSGIQFGEALLGPLLYGWKFVRNSNYTTRGPPFSFLNTATRDVTAEDPRLRHIPMPYGWIRQEDMYGDFWYWNRHKNMSHPEPRILPAELKRRGVDVQSLRIV